jgi:Protein of unknown function (DUF2889)
MSTLTSLPAPAPGTVRRTLSVEVTPGQDWNAGLRVSALGRDLLAGTGPGSARVLRATRMTVTIDAASRVTGIESTLPAAVTAPLSGASVTRGFRARLAGLGGLDPASLEAAVLDELPTVRLISGYAVMIELLAGPGTAGTTGVPAGRRGSPQIGVCAGWAAGATADRRVRAGAPLVTGTPPATAITAMTPDFHGEQPPQPRSMRRRRILDVARRPGGYAVFEYFRDSHFDAELREGALHEYEVHARAADDERVTLEHIDVVPHALPFGECPLAAPNAADLAGASLRDVTAPVRERLAGTRSCTHLNDTLRFLRYVPALAEASQSAEDR